jgi:hypothetical protein
MFSAKERRFDGVGFSALDAVTDATGATKTLKEGENHAVSIAT